MIEKRRIQISNRSIVSLNRPEGWEIFDGEGDLAISRIKTASLNKDHEDEDLGGFDLEAGVGEHPDHLFVKVFAIKKDEVNDNGDAFSAEELKKAAHTFIGCPLFCNHANDDIEKARGKVVHAWYDEEKGGIWTINMVDKVAYPQLARGIEAGYIVGTSMGAQVAYSVCSICHNKASVADEYCSHVKERKTKKFSGKVKCKYHDSKCKPEKSENCPICKKPNGETDEILHKEALVHEWNYGLKFIEDSFVVNPACHDCLVECILNKPEMEKESKRIIDKARKVANTLISEDGLLKVASSKNEAFVSLAGKIGHIIRQVDKIAKSPYSEKLLKVSGRLEIDNLNKAMKYMEVVAKSMMDQKEQVSMEYVSDIIEVLADLQTVTDELVEMGYANLQSPPTLQDPESLNDAVPLPVGNQQQGQQTEPGAMQPPQQPAPTGNPSSAPLGDVGSVTKPTLSSGKIEELRLGNGKTEQIKNISGGENIQAKESDTKMSTTNNKTAAGTGLKSEHQHVTTEKQLADAKLEFHARTGHEPEGVTESKHQLGGSEQMNDVSSDSPQVRKNEYAEVTTGSQLEAFTGTPIAPWGEYPDTILEKNWTDFSRAVGSELSKNQSDHTTQGQLQDLLSKHRWTEPDVTTENQLSNSANWLNTDNAWLDKSASAAYSKALVTAAVKALVDTIANYNITPDEVVKAAKFVTRDPQSQIKAAFITLVNGMPGKSAQRKAEVARSKYFNKASGVSAVDALLACTGDNCTNLKAEDLIDAIRFVALDVKKMASVEAKAQVKLAEKIVVEEGFDRFASFEEAFKEHQFKSKEDKDDEDKDEDSDCDKTEDDSDEPEEKVAGVHSVSIPLVDVGVPQEKTASFIAAVEKIAKAKFPGIDAVLYAVDIDDATDNVIVALKEVNTLTASEKKSIKFAKVQQRDELTREAQGLGGAMGGGMEGGGTTMPQPPGAGAAPGMPPAETLQEEPMGDEEDPMEDSDAEAKPPGSICPVCGTQDVDIVAGKGRCNNENCGAEFVFKVQVDVTKWPGVNDNNSDDGKSPDQNEEVGDSSMDGTGEGFAMPSGGAGADASIPVAAMTRLNPNMVTKLSANGSFEIGRVSPLTGSDNTFKVASNEWLCLDTGRHYEVEIAADKKNAKAMYVEWRWTPKTASEECTSCKRAKTAWDKALKTAGIKSEVFDTMSFRHKADTIITMASRGLFSTVKTASKNATVIEEIKKAYATKVFPTSECRAVIAKRFGENAIALSGPDKGMNLADCVCRQLKAASVYSDGLAIKVADAWKDKDACVECMEDYVRLGYDMEKAASVCQYMKLKYASGFELFAEELTDLAPIDNDPMGGPDGPNGEEDTTQEIGGDLGDDPFNEPSDDMSDEGTEDKSLPLGDSDSTSDPLGDGIEIDLGGGLGGGTGEIAIEEKGVGGHGSVTIELPLSALDAIEKAIDSAHGRSGDELEVDVDGAEENGMFDLENIDDIDIDIEDGADDADDQSPLDTETPDVDGDDSDTDIETDPSGSEDPFGEASGEDKEDGDKDGMGFPGSDNSETKEGKEMDHLASYMRKGKISSSGEINLDIASLAKALRKKAGDSEPKQEKSQDVVDTYTAGDGSTQGQEEKFDADKPKVPRNKALIGNEDADANPQDGPLPTVPQGEGSIGEEKELGYTADPVSLSGGVNGAGKTETASANRQKKVADKLNAPKPVSETEGLNVPRSNKDHANTPENMKRTTLSPKNYPEKVEKGEGARIKGEVDNGSVPKASPEYTPDIPVGGSKAALSKEEKSDKEFAPEKQTERSKGTVSASRGNESKIEEAAAQIAGKMVEAKMISAKEIFAKINELKQYQLPTLMQIDATLFKKVAKGLDTVPDGMEQTVIISENANQRKPVDSKDELSNSLQELFTLTSRNKMASRETEADDRKHYGRR